jgi:serine/threonine protein phosphatase 1
LLTDPMTELDRTNLALRRFTYAVGDIHGRLDLLRLAVDAISKHASIGSFRVVFLGDYVDRGPDSRGAIEFLIDLQRQWPVVCLKGNHEDLMNRAVTQPGGGNIARWLENGGDRTLRSYGAESDWTNIGAIPAEHIRWISGLPLTTRDPHRIFVHAGLLPKTPVHQQKEQTFLWVRDRFLAGHAGDFEAHIVHGHTPIWKGKPDPATPELLEYRTNLDTGAFATGVLAIGCFDAAQLGGPVEVIEVRGEPMAHLVPEITTRNHEAPHWKRWAREFKTRIGR